LIVPMIVELSGGKYHRDVDISDAILLNHMSRLWLFASRFRGR
jgi:hypothetical protein